MPTIKKKQSLWYLALASCIIIGILLSGFITLVYTPRSIFLVECSDGEENPEHTCNNGMDVDVFSIPYVQVYEASEIGVITADSVPFTGVRASDRAGISYRGVNLAGGECVGGNEAPYGEFLPYDNDAELFIYKGMNTFRIPIRWEYFAAMKDGNLLESEAAKMYIARLDRVVHELTVIKATVIIALHEPMIKLNGQLIDGEFFTYVPPPNDGRWPDDQAIPIDYTNKAIAILWSNIVKRYNTPNIVYDMMNAHMGQLFFSTLHMYVDQSFKGIQKAESELNITVPHLILTTGDNGGRIDLWFDDAMTDPNPGLIQRFYREMAGSSRFAITIQQFFDTNGTGNYTREECALVFNATKLRQTWIRLMDWSRAQNIPIFVNAFGAPDTQNCRMQLKEFLNLLALYRYSPECNCGVIGWTVSGGGMPGCGVESSFISIAPGGRANGLMWDTFMGFRDKVYETYLEKLVTPIPPLEEKRLAIYFNNQLNDTLIFLRGYVPFQTRGLVDVETQGYGRIYSNNNFSTPTVGIQNHYVRTVTKSLTFIVGFDPLLSSPYASIHSSTTEGADLVFKAFQCPINKTGLRANQPGIERCFTLVPTNG